MGVTATYSLPYPEPTDAPDGPAQLEALADAVEDEVERVDAALIDAHRVAVKASATSRDTTTTPADDPDLTLTVEAGASYTGRLVLYVSSTVSNSGDLALRFAFPSGSSMSWGLHGLDPAITTGFVAALAAPVAEATSSPTNTLTAGLSTSFSMIAAWLYIDVGSAGSLTLQWAQASSSGNASLLRARSHLVLERIG